MRLASPFVPVAAVIVALLLPAAAAEARSPRNPYSGFNLSGINYGAQQWERAQRQGKQVWPYYNTPSRGSGRGGTVSVGGVGGGTVGGRTSRSAPGRWRR